ncbi:hypothetical protein ACXDTH_000362 [Klebsiella variicola]
MTLPPTFPSLDYAFKCRYISRQAIFLHVLHFLNCFKVIFFIVRTNMINGRDEIFAVKGAFSKPDASNLESICANIEIKLNEMYGPKQEEKHTALWNPIRFYIFRSTTSSTGEIYDIMIGVHSTAAVAREGREQLIKQGYDVGDLVAW